MGLAAAGIAFFPALAVGSFLNVVAARVPLRRSTSIADRTTSTAQKNDAIAASQETPNFQKHAPTSSAVASSTAG